jgi:3-hydroxyisobutyrate dehydrogenase-like beta-hydroxyacid dehydrogenase
MKTVGVIGLGEMGLPMAANLVARGFEVTGYDLRASAVKALEESGGHAAGSAAEAARGRDAIVVMVRTPAQAEQVVLGPGGVLAEARADAIVIVMSTIGVAAMQRLGAAARDRGLAFLDAPVSGGRARAEAGTLTIIVGGSTQDLATARPALEAVGSQLEHVGAIGAGTAVKMANQVLLTVSLLAAREVADLAAAQGVAAERLWEVLRTCTGTTWVVENWSTAAGWLRDYRPGSSLDILVKDTALALDLARDLGLPARLVPLCAQMVQELTRHLAGAASEAQGSSKSVPHPRTG